MASIIFLDRVRRLFAWLKQFVQELVTHIPSFCLKNGRLPIAFLQIDCRVRQD